MPRYTIPLCTTLHPAPKVVEGLCADGDVQTDKAPGETIIIIIITTMYY